MTQSKRGPSNAAESGGQTDPGLFGNVWVVTSNESCVLHVAPDCPRLSGASVRGPVDRAKFPNGEYCSWCAGHATDKAAKGNDREHYNALRASADD